MDKVDEKVMKTQIIKRIKYYLREKGKYRNYKYNNFSIKNKWSYFDCNEDIIKG